MEPNDFCLTSYFWMDADDLITQAREAIDNSMPLPLDLRSALLVAGIDPEDITPTEEQLLLPFEEDPFDL